MTCETFFLEKLRKRGFRLTPQREIVLSALHQIDKMASADHILDRVHEVSAAVDLSTVYRTLDLLEEFELVISSDLGEGHREYKLIGPEEPHLHLVCRKCGKVIGAEMEPAEALSAYTLKKYGFKVDLEHLSFPGLCSDCRAGM